MSDVEHADTSTEAEKEAGKTWFFLGKDGWIIYGLLMAGTYYAFANSMSKLDAVTIGILVSVAVVGYAMAVAYKIILQAVDMI